MWLIDFPEQFAEAIYSGDATVRTWFLVSNDYAPIIICSLYVLMVKSILPRFMENREPYDLRKLMIFYNFGIVVTYLSLLAVAIYFLQFVEWGQFCIMSSLAEQGWYETAGIRLGWIYYLSKYVELIDTFFFVLRKKEHLITNLHVIHHFTVPIIGWILLRSERSGFQALPAVLNGIVHIVMYTYYGMAAIGPSMRKYLWWKRYLTLFQMMQFVIDILYGVVVWPLTGCPAVKTGIYMDLFLGSFFLILFYNFYHHTFLKKKKCE